MDGSGVPVAGLLQGSGDAKDSEGAPCNRLWALNAHHCCSGWWVYYSCLSFSPRDAWQELINQKIKVAFAKARQSAAGPWGARRASTRP